MSLHTYTLEDMAAEILTLSPGEQSLAAAAAIKIFGAANSKTTRQVELEQDWQVWLRTLFPQYFFCEFGEHHKKFWEWVWRIRLGFHEPPEINVWPRGQGKSTNAEAACAAWAARGTRKYLWYICETQDQADDHVGNVAAMLESKSMREFYPQLGERLLNKFGTSKGWKRNRIRTATGFTLDGLGLDVARRGVKLEEQRPDGKIFDDIDGKHDSPQVTAKKGEIVTTSILPAGSRDSIDLGIQNLITKDSLFSQLVDGRAEWLIDRNVSGPIPALRDFDFEKRGRRYFITSGKPTWEGQNLEVCQHFIDTWGITAFQTECQHKVDLNMPGAIFPEWNEILHVITESEFKRYYGEIALKNPNDPESAMQIPLVWNRGRGLDWGTTPGHPTVCENVARPYETHKLTDSVFVYRELTMPEFPYVDENIRPVSPRRVKKAILAASSKLEEKNITISAMSHEASAALNTFMQDYLDGNDKELLWFNKWKPQTGSGVPQIQNALEIDNTKEHPFRRYPRGFKLKGVDVGGKPLMGRPRFFVIVPDAQGELFFEKDEMELRVRGAVDNLGMARLRYEFPKYRNPVTAAGQEKAKPNPKAHGEDDAIDALRGLANLFFPTVKDMSEEERIETLLHDNLKAENIEKRRQRGEDVQGAQSRRRHEMTKLKKKISKANVYSPLADYRRKLRSGGK